MVCIVEAQLYIGNRILSILLPGILDTVFNILITFRDIENLGKLIMGIFTSLSPTIGFCKCNLNSLSISQYKCSAFSQ